MLLPLGSKLHEHFKQPKMKNETEKLLIWIQMLAFRLIGPSRIYHFERYMIQSALIELLHFGL